jgi:hypothetical protein
MAATHAAREEALRWMIDRGDHLPGRVNPMIDLERWLDRMGECSTFLTLRSCPSRHHVSVRGDCCEVLFCPLRERRLSQEKIRDARARMTRLSDEIWRFITVNIKPRNSLKEDVDRVWRLRDGFFEAFEKLGAKGGFGVVDFGVENERGHGNVHLHFLIAGLGFVDRELLQGLLRSTDCTVAACEHPADDRCDDCKAAKRACEHLDGDRRRCNGSWYVDIRLVRCLECVHEDRRNGQHCATYDCPRGTGACAQEGAREAIKYGAKPVSSGAIPEVGSEISDRELCDAERVIKFYVATYKKKRIKAFGAMKAKATDEELALADAELADDDSETLVVDRDHCRKCGNRLRVIAWGALRGSRRDGYQWQSRSPTKGILGRVNYFAGMARVRVRARAGP